MTKRSINRGIDLRSRRNKQTQGAPSRRQQGSIGLQLSLVFTNVLETVHTQNGIPTFGFGNVIDRAGNQFLVRVCLLEYLAKGGIRFDRDNLVEMREALELRGHLTNAGADFQDAALQVRLELTDEGLAVVARFTERGK